MPATAPKIADTISPTLDPAARTALETLRVSMVRLLDEKPAIVDICLCAVLTSGHLLLEDVPGIGKTTFVKAAAKLFGLDMRRVQFTSDLLPADITGVPVYNATDGKFHLHRGPIFTQILLADELNRASPRTQSALLEAMGEGFVTLDGQTYPLPRPFVVFATQNPVDSIGTYPLPESQLDRFAARIRLDYPAASREREIFRLSAKDPLDAIPTAEVDPAALAKIFAATEAVFISERVADYAKRFVDATRLHEGLSLGVSTRGGVSWLRMARAKALLANRGYVTPDDLMALASFCLSHRIVAKAGRDTRQIIQGLLDSVAID